MPKKLNIIWPEQVDKAISYRGEEDETLATLLVAILSGPVKKDPRFFIEMSSPKDDEEFFKNYNKGRWWSSTDEPYYPEWLTPEVWKKNGPFYTMYDWSVVSQITDYRHIIDWIKAAYILRV